MVYKMVALCMSSVAHITPAACLCASSAHQGQREGLRAQLNLKLIYLHSLPNCLLPPVSFPLENLMAKLPGFLWGQALPYFRMYLCLARRRGQYPGPIKVNGNQ